MMAMSCRNIFVASNEEMIGEEGEASQSEDQDRDNRGQDQDQGQGWAQDQEGEQDDSQPGGDDGQDAADEMLAGHDREEDED